MKITYLLPCFGELLLDKVIGLTHLAAESAHRRELKSAYLDAIDQLPDHMVFAFQKPEARRRSPQTLGCEGKEA
jgi:hypothetical protein